MKVLLIEDNTVTIAGLIDAIADRGWEKEVVSFDKAEEAIYLFDPDVVVMDWMYDEEDTERGKPILERIVSNEFRPVIVFSALDLADELEELSKQFPLVVFTRKGDDDSKIAEQIDGWITSARALTQMRHSMNTALVESARALYCFQKMEHFPEPSIVSFMLSRRAIQYFEQSEVGGTPPTWIQYIYPPIAENLLVADIIRVYSEETFDITPGRPEEYWVVLSPSCDMVNHGAPDFKVLTCHCCGKERFTDLRLVATDNCDSGKGKDKVKRVVKELQYGYNKAFVPLPELPNILPYMTANLKELNFCTLAEIAPSKEMFDESQHRYFRVSSIASPFREQVVWAHMINSCRPGMPERDTTSWAKGILI